MFIFNFVINIYVFILGLICKFAYNNELFLQFKTVEEKILKG